VPVCMSGKSYGDFMYNFQSLNFPRLPTISNANVGMVFMITAMMLLPIGDTLAKLLTSVVSPAEVAMWRFLAQALCLVPLAFVLRRRLRGAMFSPIVAFSGVLIVISVTTLITAFAVMAIATAIAIFFVEPLILTILASVFLRETIGPRRLVAVGVGLLGALIVIRPGFSEFGFATILPLISACAYAANMIVLRYACQERSSLTVQCGATIYAALAMVFLVFMLNMNGDIAFSVPSQPSWFWLAILGAGALAALCFLLIAEAFRRSEAGALAPFQYLEILGATAAGFLVFGDFPDSLTWLGITIILASGFYVFHREQKANKNHNAQTARRGGAR